MNKAYAYGKSVRITAESLGIAIPAFGTITVMFCVTSEISVIIIVYITSGLGDGDKNLSCQRHTWGACHYSLPSYLLCPRAFKLWGALPEGVMLIIKSNLSSRIVSTNTSAQLFIAALGTSAFSRIRNPFLVCPCENQSPPPATKMAYQPACQGVWLSVLVSLRRAFYIQSLLFVSTYNDPSLLPCQGDGSNQSYLASRGWWSQSGLEFPW